MLFSKVLSGTLLTTVWLILIIGVKVKDATSSLELALQAVSAILNSVRTVPEDALSQVLLVVLAVLIADLMAADSNIPASLITVRTLTLRIMLDFLVSNLSEELLVASASLVLYPPHLVPVKLVSVSSTLAQDLEAVPGWL